MLGTLILMFVEVKIKFMKYLNKAESYHWRVATILQGIMEKQWNAVLTVIAEMNEHVDTITLDELTAA